MSHLPLFKRLSSRPRLRIVRDDSEPVVLPFLQRDRRAAIAHALLPNAPRTVAIQFRRAAGRMDPLTRARVLHENRCCPRCRRAGAIPLDLGDGDGRNPAMPVPGSSTLIGFYCDACGAEWRL